MTAQQINLSKSPLGIPLSLIRHHGLAEQGMPPPF
jgi:hypothetical protein